MRVRLDADAVVEAALDALHKTLKPDRTSIYLTDEAGNSRLAAIRPEGAAQPVPSAVAEAARRRRLTANPLVGTISAPIVAPQTGLLGVIHVEGGSDSADSQMFIEGVAREAGFALETANLYESAVAEKEKSEAILARVGDGVVVTDTSGRIAQWNEAAERITACPRSAALGASCHDVLGLSVDGVELDCSEGCALLRQQREGDAALGLEVWRWRADGRRQPLLANVAAVRGPDGSVTEVVHSLRDITKLKEADEAKTMFLATASHELKTPLTVIQGFAEALIDKPDWAESDRARALEAMRGRAAELDRVVNRMLLSSRIEAGRNRVETSEFDVLPLLRERVEALHEATGQQVAAELPDALPAAVADPEALATVIDHLLDNARKYSPDGGAITLSAEADERELRISIADEGIGMDPEQVTHCFDKFWQAESSDVRRFGGTGIGLYIVQSLVRGMGGDIGVESGLGAGTTFTFTLRRAGAPEPEGSEPQDAADEQIGPVKPEPSIVREFMRQIGVPDRSTR